MANLFSCIGTKRQAVNLDDKLELSPDATARGSYHGVHASATTVKNRPTVTTKVVMGQLAIGSAVENKPSLMQALMVLNHSLRQREESCAHT
jgi:hypothetical protein